MKKTVESNYLNSMGQVIQSSKIERHIITEQGEMTVTINLNLTIKLDSSSPEEINVSVPVSSTTKKEPLMIPDFGESSEIIDFGK